MEALWVVISAVTVFLVIQWGNDWFELQIVHLNRQAAHALLETFGFAICFAILILGWMVFVPTLCRQRLMTAALFTGVGLLDLLHAFSAPGMPLYQDSIGETPSML